MTGFPIQADSLRRMRQLVAAVATNDLRTPDRQAHYYIAAAHALDLVDDSNAITTRGQDLLRTREGSPDEAVQFERAIKESAAVSTIAPDIFDAVAPSIDTLAKNIIQRYAHTLTTARRRAATLLRWREQVIAQKHQTTAQVSLFDDVVPQPNAPSKEPEIEDESLGEGEHKPWNPDEIRVDPKAFSLRQIMDYVDDGDIDLVPDFQRREVWNLAQKIRLMESILLRIPLPAFYFDADKNGLMHVVDGLQRLSTIHSFFKNQFTLHSRDLEYLRVDPTVCDRTYDDLDVLWKRRIQNTQIVAHVIDPQTPPQVKFNIFKRINTGGSPLTLQEMRHCMMSQRARDVLRTMCDLASFKVAVPASIISHPRMIDRELALRFTAFLQAGVNAYGGDMDGFLSKAAEQLDEQSTADIERLVDAFDTAMANAAALFGRHAFRKWPADEERLQPLNKPLFESMAVMLTRHSASSLSSRKDGIVRTLRTRMRDDTKYNESITTSTGDVNKVTLRFNVAAAVLEAS